MVETYDAAWYDTAMTEAVAPSMLPLEESPWLGVYEDLARKIRPHEPVVDLGCGTGRFLELLRRSGHQASLVGVDFSPAALEAALDYWGGNKDEPSLRLEDLRVWQPDPEPAVYVCSEVLEHLEDDWGLVGKIPTGSRLLFSVPNFDSEAHVRVFESFADVMERYAGLVRFCSWRLVELDEEKGFHVCETVAW